MIKSEDSTTINAVTRLLGVILNPFSSEYIFIC